MMELTESVELAAPADEVFAVVEDLGRYPEWLSIVPRAVAVEGDPPAWMVDLKGRLGPLSRAKRLRMERTLCEAPTRVRFERREQDGRNHSAWVLDALVAPRGAGVDLTMTLRYGGALWVPMLDRMLRQEIEGSRPRLAALLTG
jgi:hypothetical protein